MYLFQLKLSKHWIFSANFDNGKEYEWCSCWRRLSQWEIAPLRRKNILEFWIILLLLIYFLIYAWLLNIVSF